MKYNLFDEVYKEMLKEATFKQKLKLYFCKYFYKIKIELENLIFRLKRIIQEIKNVRK